jgi:hypothetical protein
VAAFGTLLTIKNPVFTGFFIGIRYVTQVFTLFEFLCKIGDMK